MLKKNFDYQGLLGEGNPLLRYPELLDAAIEEFSKKKFEDASLNDILKNANMSKGSLYHNFGDKFGLYLSLIDIIVKKKISFFVPFLQKRQDSGDVFETIKDVIRATMEFMCYDERLYHLSNRFQNFSDELKERILEYMPNNYNEWFLRLISSAIESGQINSLYSPQFIVNILELFFTNIHKFLSTERSVEAVVATVDQMIDLMQYGISAKKEDK